GRQKINWMPRPAIACATSAAPGLHVRTTSQLVRGCREGVMEFLLINHPLDCPICDQAGECRLQEQATQYGRGYSRFIEPKNVKPKRTLLGARVMLDDERCIRFCKEIARDDVLGFVDRGSFSTLTCFPGRTLENNYSLNTVDICPVGALTSTDFRFKMRVWLLKQTNSVETESSAGANTIVWSREGVIHRITPRRNDAVNDTWMSDSARLLYQLVRSEDRLGAVRVNGADNAFEAAVDAAALLLKQGGVAVVGSGRSSVEEQYLTRLLAEAAGATAYLVARSGPSDGILVSADRNPNTRGALVTGLVTALPAANLSVLGAEIDAGRVRTVVSVGEDLAAAGLTAEQIARLSVIHLGTHRSATSAAAKVLIPALTVFEKNGTFVNQQFRIQKFQAAVPGPAGATDDSEALGRLLSAVTGCAAPGQARGGRPGVDLNGLWDALAAAVPALAQVRFRTLPDSGLLLDATAWADLPFPEGPALHHTPAAAAAKS
ncbi:MAG: molybdopterin-dependent oxidoreductase, partial [Opitutaceae bacterium]